MSVMDLRRTQRWYREVLGLVQAGGTNTFAGPLASRVQGLPRAASTCWWLLDGQDDFQLEFFQFRRPSVRPLPADWRRCDIGYAMLSLHVDDLDATLARAAVAGTLPLTEPAGSLGGRRVCLRDPEGVLIELMEDDPRGVDRRRRRLDGPPSKLRSVTLSVPDLDRSRHTFGDVLGLVPNDDVELHTAAHEALWGLEGATRMVQLYWAKDFLIELVQYTDPVAKPWPPGYRISDQGLLNIAFLFETTDAARAALARCVTAGLRPNSRLITIPGLGGVTYVNDADGFSIEMLSLTPRARRWFGFAPRPTPRFAPFLPSGRLRPLTGGGAGERAEWGR